VLAEVQCGSQDWTWDDEWADLDHYRAEQLAALEPQIKANGITKPVLIGSDGRLWDGHHRLRLAVRLGIGYVPVRVHAAAVSQPDGEA
jgi:ParB-like chromosome segregation protein Spo0J